MPKKWTAVILIVMAILFSSAPYVHATLKKNAKAGTCKLPDLRVDERPGPADRPTQVSVGLRLINVTEIEDTNQTITADFFVSQTWVDPRLTGFEGCQFSLDEVWTPQIDITNSGRLFTRLRKQVEVLESGRVRHVQRYRGSLVFRYDAHRFPFDHHDIVITLLCIEHGQKDVTIIIDKSITGRNPAEFDVADWTISQVQANVGSKYLDVFNSNHSAFNFSISAERRSGYYIWKVIVPLMLIVFMSWTVFWIDPSNLGPQIGMSATSMLTLIAFQFAMANILPKLSYYTILDKFIAGSTILVFLALIESVTTSWLCSNHKKDTSFLMDRVCRWTFPVAFVAMTLLVFYA
jgi:gamma-aminobutyric acid receptor subunit beta